MCRARSFLNGSGGVELVETGESFSLENAAEPGQMSLVGDLGSHPGARGYQGSNDRGTTADSVQLRLQLFAPQHCRGKSKISAISVLHQQIPRRFHLRGVWIMRIKNLTLCVCFSVVTSACPPVLGQTDRGLADAPSFEEVSPAQPQITTRLDETKRLPLKGNTHPDARSEFDKGLVDPQLPMKRMILVLKRSPAQEAALEAFMARQLDPKSPDFHRWLRPEEFGEIYGPSDADISAVTNWLQNYGFSMDKVANGRTFIEFSGTAGLVQKAFHTEIHHYTINGEKHIANNSDPSIPEALSSVVEGVLSLHNFFSKPLHRNLGSFHRAGKSGGWEPDDPAILLKPMFGVTSGATYELVSPYDFATIYNVLPLWSAGIDGTGQTIAIAGRSDIDLSDVATFRSSFGLPANPPTVIVNGPDPGVPSLDDKLENTLDVEWSGGVAKGATIEFITTASTMSTDGAVSSALYIVDNNTAPIMSFSYGECELDLGTAGNTAINNMWQQGAAEGITEFVASGDQGAAACDGGRASPYLPQEGLAVSGTSSTPYNVAVGGTDFQWPNLSGTYWSSTNNSTNLSSALSYIPEVPWNGTCASDDIRQALGFTSAGYTAESLCNELWTIHLLGYDLDAQLLNATGGTGGMSSCTTPLSNTVASCSGGYAKPSWQTATGVPADGKRDVPDVSLFASAGELYSAYSICDSDLGPCNYSVTADALGQAVGGTSVSSPAMAGVMAMVLQKIGGAAQGLANPVFYQLASQENLSGCNSGTITNNGNSCIFYDITTDNIRVPCATGSPNCITGTPGDAVGILSSYDALTGYDLATGLGSVNAANLVNSWVSTGVFGAAPNQLSFGSQLINTSGTPKAVFLSNHLNVTAAITSITASANWSQTNNCGSYLASGATCTVNVSFKPTAIGALNGTLAIQSPQGNISVSLLGTGIGPIVTFSAQSITFPSETVGISSPAHMIYLQNTGTATLTGIAISVSGTNAADFGETTSCGTTLAAGSSCSISIVFTPGATGARTATLSVADNATGSPQSVPITGTGTIATITSALQFVPVTPCRIADTRNATGPFGGPQLAAGSTRTFNIPQSACGIPSNAVAYSVNVTVLPNQFLGFLTIWPAGIPKPFVSTLNSYDGRVKANAVIVPAGIYGGVSVYVTDATQFVLDIDGYFVSSSGLEFFPLTPCRIADTRNAAGPLGGPSLAALESRSFPVLSSSCAIPATAQAYSVNITAVPHSTLGFLTAWPSGQAKPFVSTLNSYTGVITANAAIVPAGSGGDVSIFVSDAADVFIDVNGYFAPPATGGLSLYTVTPCRVIDTRAGVGTFAGTLAVPVTGSSCAPPATAQAFVLNASVEPPGFLGFLTLWADGGAKPFVSTLNAYDGALTSNMAIVPTANGSIDAFSTNSTQMWLDLSGYFAP